LKTNSICQAIEPAILRLQWELFALAGVGAFAVAMTAPMLVGMQD